MTHFKLFSNCIITKGANRGIILDIQRGKIFFIPNDLIEVVTYLNCGNSINSSHNKFGFENKYIIDEYINFLIENELGFNLTEKEYDFFPDMKLNFHTPSHITNAIIEFSNNNIISYKSILESICSLNCRYLQFIFYDWNLLNDLKDIINISYSMNFRSIEILTNYDEKVKGILQEIIDNAYIITSVSLFNIPESERNLFNNKQIPIVFFDYELNSFKHCGAIDKKYFVIGKESFTESLNHNSCLHKKITIDKEGNIKNCPAMTQNFGNIHNSSLDEALNHPDFKKYWNVTKDLISVCKDCEFRHICTDCRAFTEQNYFQKDLDLSKPLKCGYNPYTNQWEEWSNNPLKQKAIEYYRLQELIKNV